MRFLYGDTEPFPPQYDFLAALQAFVANASRAVQLDAEVRALRAAADAADAARTSTLTALTTFHESRMRSLAQAMPVDAEPPTREYVRQLSELALSIVEAAKAQSAQAGELERQRANAEIDRRRSEIRAKLAAFLTVLRLPSSSSSASMRLHEGHNELAATIRGDDGVAVSFVLTTRDDPAWQLPRKVSDFAQGIDLPVGVRRSWFSKGVQHEMAHIDDYVVGGFELAESSAEIRLRKKPGDKDTIVFNAARHEGGALRADVHHPGDAEAEGLGAELDDAARGHIERLWDALRTAAAGIATHRERVLGVTMDDVDVVEHDGVPAFVASIIRQIAPTVVEIAKRSSSASELALKAESEKGRREEIYLKKAELLEHLTPLGATERELFAPLAFMPAAPPSEKKAPRESGPDDGAWEAPP